MVKALIVDDNYMNREMLCEMLEDEYEIISAVDGVEALEKIDEYGKELGIILLDIVMPRLDGFGVLNGLRERELQGEIPVLIISGESASIERECFDYGVADFIRKPFDNRVVKIRVKNNYELRVYKQGLVDRVRQQTKLLSDKNRILSEQAEKLQQSNVNIIEILGTVVEARNLESGLHIQRVKNYSEIIGRTIMEKYPEYGLTEKDINLIVGASPLHDIGKIMIPDAVLLKPGKLIPEEWELMRSHTLLGCELLEKVKYMWAENYHKMSWEICRWHHERYDGNGYPEGLKGDDIPIAAQIVALADVYDALVNERTYKKAFSKEKAYEMIVGGECGVFSPKIIDCFNVARSEMEKYVDGNAE